MKKIFSIIIMFSLIFNMGGCIHLEKTKEKIDMPKRERAKKILKVGMDVGYEPFEYYEEDGTTIAGIDYDLAQAICEKMGYVLEVEAKQWDQIFEGLDNKEYDLIISAVSINDERKEKYDFTAPYVENYQSLVTLNKASRKPKELIMLKGLKVGVLKSSTSEKYLREYVSSKKISCGIFPYETIKEAFKYLEAGKLETVICDSILANKYCSDATYEMTWKDETVTEEIAICLAKDSVFTEEVDKALSEIKKSGELKKIIDKYMKAD